MPSVMLVLLVLSACAHHAVLVVRAAGMDDEVAIPEACMGKPLNFAGIYDIEMASISYDMDAGEVFGSNSDAFSMEISPGPSEATWVVNKYTPWEVNKYTDPATRNMSMAHLQAQSDEAQESKAESICISPMTKKRHGVLTCVDTGDAGHWYLDVKSVSDSCEVLEATYTYMEAGDMQCEDKKCQASMTYGTAVRRK